MRKIFVGFIVLVMICIGLPNVIKSVEAASEVVRYEAEDATIQGAEIATAVEGYSGTGYVDGLKDTSDYIQFTIDVEKDGLYLLNIGYCAMYGYKEETIVVNDSQSFSAVFEENTEFTNKSVGFVKLVEGKNTIRIERFWGWTLIDYIEIAPASDFSISTDVSDSLINPNATETTQKLMTYLTSIYGKNILAGQFAYTTKYTEIDAIYNNTGKYPAVLGLDFSDYSPSRIALGCNPGQDTDKAIEWWNDGGIVTFCWHWQSPIGASTEESKKWGGFYTENTTYDLAVAMSDETSEEYVTLIRDIDAIAEQLLILQDAGVPILWRPLHEASGGWFWWGAAGSDNYIKLWKLMYDRLTNYHGINNLIWVWNAQSADWYPGDEYVDIIGEDVYANKHDYSSQMNKFFKAMNYTTTNKMITLSENGVLPDPDELQADGIPWSYNNTWGGEFVVPYVGASEYSETYTELSMLKKFYLHDYVITRDELPASLFEISEEDRMTVEITGVDEELIYDNSTQYTPITLVANTKNADGASITFYADNKKIGTGEEVIYTPSGTTTSEDGLKEVVITVVVSKNGRTVTDQVTITLKLPVVQEETTVKLEVATANVTSGSGTVNYEYQILNYGEELELSKLELCYYYTKDVEKTQHGYVDHAAIQYNKAPWYVTLTSSCIPQIVEMVSEVQKADHYVSFTFDSEEKFSKDGKLILQGRILNSDYSQMVTTDDYSFENGLVIYYDGAVVWGIEPK